MPVVFLCSAVIQVQTESGERMQSLLTDLHALAKLTPASQASIQQLPFGATTEDVLASKSAVAPVVPAAAVTKPASTPSAPAAEGATSAHMSSGKLRRVLVLGSGYVAAPVVAYLTQPGRGNEVTVASLELASAQKLCEGNAAARPMFLNAQDFTAVEAAVKSHDFVISLLPATAHVPIAKACIAHKRSMVTASYISPDMRRLHSDAARAGICIMNEMGLDPGIDHMSAMAIIDSVRDAGGRVISFESMCGGLPAPEAADNPLAYKFSWSPRGVLLAAQNPAKFRRDGKLVEIEGKNLMASASPINILPALNLEHLPNRDSLQYGTTYRIDQDEHGGPGADTIYRGTLRYRGFSELMLAFSRLGLLDLQARSDFNGTWRQLIAELVNVSGPGAQVAKGVQDKLAAAGISSELQHRTLEACQWLGLLSDRQLQWRGTVMDTFCALLQEKLAFRPGERDMVLLHHRFVVEHADKSRERILSTLLSFGDSAPGGYSGMARTVGFPAAVAAQYMMEGIITRKGVIDPTPRDVYVPVLRELKNYQIDCVETVSKIEI
jgi:saccharopine dehydrogenase-like NADP-dependent oxidoreductase